MKKIIFSIIAIAAISLGHAQIDRSKMPEPGPAPEIEIGDYETFTLKNGLKVFVVENDKLPQVNFSLIIDRDPIVEGDKAGYVSIAGDLLREGTTNRSKTELDEEVDFIGGRLSTSSTSVFGSSLSEYKEKMMELMADVILNPSFPEESFEKLRKQSISGLEFSKNDPNSIARRVMGVLLYGKDHPYGELQTEETLNNVTLEDCKNYYKSFFIPNNSYLAVVGDIKTKDAKKLVKKYLGDWAFAEFVGNSYESPEQPETRQVGIVNRDNAVQSVIRIGNTTELKPGSKDVIPLRIANKILGGGSTGRLFQNLREDKAYTYGAYSSYDSDKVIGSFTAFASVRNEVTDSAITQFYVEMDKIRNEKISEEELKNAKVYITGQFARSLESPETIARFAINTERYDLPSDYYQNYLKKVDAVSVAEVKNAAVKHIQPEKQTILVVGKGSEVGPKVEKFGPVTYYDKEGNKVEAPTSKEADKTAEEVLNMYLEAIGGKNMLEDVNDLYMKMEGTIQGQPLVMVSKEKRPNMSLTSISMSMGGQEMEVMKVKFDGKNLKQVMRGQTMPTKEEDIEEAKYQSHMFPELEYLSNEAFKTEVKSLKTIEGEDAYEVEITYPNDKVITNYYSAETGFKIRKSQTQEGPQGQQMTTDTDYSNYQQVDGIFIPYSITLPMGPTKVEMQITDVMVNSGLDASEFEVKK